MTRTEAGLHIARSGHPPGDGRETFVLVHGFGASSFTWRHWAPHLEKRGHVAQVDLLGCGRSPAPRAGPYDPEGQARLLMDALHRLHREDGIHPASVTLVGHSLGGGIALYTALELQRTGTPPKRLVLVASAAYPQRMPPFVGLARRPRLARWLFRAIPAPLLVGQVLRSIVFDAGVVTQAMVEGYTGPLERPDAVHALMETARHIEPPDLGELTLRYPHLRLPTLLLWGARDRVVPPWVGQRLAEALPDARLRVLPRCGHMPQDEWPDLSWSVLEAFLDETRTTHRFQA